MLLFNYIRFSVAGYESSCITVLCSTCCVWCVYGRQPFMFTVCRVFRYTVKSRLPKIFDFSPVSFPNFIHARKYGYNIRHSKGMRGLRVAGFLKYNVRVNYPAWRSKREFLHANFLSNFLVFASVNLFKTLHSFTK